MVIDIADMLIIRQHIFLNAGHLVFKGLDIYIDKLYAHIFLCDLFVFFYL